MYLGRPPVDIGRSRAAVTLHTMMRGSSHYSQAAGGFGAVLALPQLQAGLKASPAAANRDPQLAAYYPLSPAAFKLRLRQQFGG